MSYRRLLYSFVLYCIFPFVILRLFWRSRNNRAYRQRINERLGLFKLKSHRNNYHNSNHNSKHNKNPVIWVHAVSVGETIAAKPLVDALIDQYPEHQILVTSTTPTGSEMVKKLLGDNVLHVYFPYDLPDIVFRFINRVNPQLLIIVETEIWPNLYATCEKRHIPMMLANARLSPASTKGYLKIKGLIEETLQRLEVIAVRSQVDAIRFKQLGALDKQIMVAGNIKFDLKINEEQIKKGQIRKEQWGVKRPVWVAASTHAGEEDQILSVYSHLLQAYPKLLLVLIPRHLERFDAVFDLCKTQADLTIVRHSQQHDYKGCNAHIILGDSMGEMQSWYATADVVFMGGSLVATGGHNPLEATKLGKPVLSGPHLFNFEDIYPILKDAGLCWVCDDIDQVKKQMMALLREEVSVSEFVLTANNIIKEQGGVTARLMSHVLSLNVN